MSESSCQKITPWFINIRGSVLVCPRPDQNCYESSVFILGVTEKKLENAPEAQKSAAANNMDDELAGFLAVRFFIWP